jgi:hypothetical protein
LLAIEKYVEWNDAADICKVEVWIPFKMKDAGNSKDL